MKALFVRAVDAEDKGAVLRNARASLCLERSDPNLFEVSVSAISKIPGAPFAYWVSERVRELFEELSAFDTGERRALHGASTKNDFRFVRLTWEVLPSRLAATAEDTYGGKKWARYAKGGRHSRFFGELYCVVNWLANAREIEQDVLRKYPYLRGNAEWVLHRENPYFSPGITWPLRGITFSAQAVPAGCVFSVGGKMAVAPRAELPALLGLMNTQPFDELIKLFAGKIGGVQYEAGLIGSVPTPSEIAGQGELATQGWQLKRRLAGTSQVSSVFTVPETLAVGGESVEERIRAWSATVDGLDHQLAAIEAELNELALGSYEVRHRDIDPFDARAPLESEEEVEQDSDESELAPDRMALTSSLLEWTVGVAFGRFDIRLATGERPIPKDPDPFDPLPVCSPGMLQDEDGLPATTSPSDYPIEVAWNGILVDDEGHPRDIVRHMRRVLSEVSDGQDWAAEAEEILGRDLRSWVQRSLFEDHIKRYSKSRRKAPLFWRLGTSSGSYSVWLYYPRATGDTLYRVLNDYVEPKLRHEESALLRLRQEAGSSPTASQQKRIETQESLVSEVQNMKGELEVLAQLWRPEFDDGVVLNFAPFWRLVAHTRTWQKECQKHWKKLREGEYDWSYTAMRLWPERIVPACAEDRSFAIAHGLEEEFFPEEAEGGEDGGASMVRETEHVAKLLDARSSAAVKQALQTLLER